MNPTDLAWTAGIIEGEGSVRIGPPGPRSLGALCVTVTSTDPDMLTPLQEWYGGRISPTSTRPECKPAWRWTLSSQQAAAMLEAIEPFCRVERIRAKVLLGIEYQAQKSNSRTVNRSAGYRARQFEYWERLRAMNVRGAA